MEIDFLDLCSLTPVVKVFGAKSIKCLCADKMDIENINVPVPT